MIARYGSDLEDDSDEESEDENANVSGYRLRTILDCSSIVEMDRWCGKRISPMLFHLETTWSNDLQFHHQFLQHIFGGELRSPDWIEQDKEKEENESQRCRNSICLRRSDEPGRRRTRSTRAVRNHRKTTIRSLTFPLHLELRKGRNPLSKSKTRSREGKFQR